MAPADEEIEPAEATLLARALHFLSLSGLCIALSPFLFNLWVSRLVPSLSADSLIYHLTIPAHWTQRGFLQTPDLPFHDGAAEHSPLLTETMIYGLMKLTGNDDLAFLIQPTFFLLTVSIFYWSARQLGLQLFACRFLTAFVLLFSPFFHSSLIVNSEMVMTCGVAVFCYGMLLTRMRRAKGFLVAAAGISLTLASKTVGVIYGSLALVILAAWFVMELRKECKTDAPFRWKQVAILSLAIIFCGLFFHFHNLWLYGNPLYPAELRVFGLTFLPGRYNASVFIHHGWTPAAFSKMLLSDTESYAMNRQFGIVLWLAMLVPLGMLVFRRLKLADWLPTTLFVFYPLASILVYFAVVPFWTEHRLLFPVYYLLWCGLGWSLHLLTRERSQATGEFAAAAVGLAYIVYACFFLVFDEVPLLLLVAAGVLGIVVANYPRLLKWNGERPWLIPAATIVVLICSSPWWYPDLANQRTHGRTSAYAQMYGPQGEAWNRLADLTAKKPTTIAYSGNALTYPLFGSRQANRVVYLPVGPLDQPTPVVLTKADTIYGQLARARRAEGEEKYWLQQLQEKKVDYLLLINDPKFDGVELERTFAAHHPQLLQLIWEQDGVWIYAVQRSESGS